MGGYSCTGMEAVTGEWGVISHWGNMATGGSDEMQSERGGNGQISASNGRAESCGQRNGNPDGKWRGGE